jgi:hypothetical protein
MVAMQSPETDRDDAPDPTGTDADRAWARRLHELTGEVELIISGGMLLALTQVPGHLDAWWDTIGPRLVNPYYTAVFVVWYYMKLMVYTLVGAFGVHIFARAYWVGLLGLDSVFPHGIRWDRVRYGPIAKRTYRASFRPLSTMARRADYFGSTIFSFAFWIVLLFVISITVAVITGVGALILNRWVVRGVPLGVTWWSLLGVIAFSPVLATVVDRLAGERLKPTGVVARAIRGVLRGSYVLFAGPFLLPIQFTLMSNVRRGAMHGVMAIVLIVLVGLFIGGEVVRSGDVVVSSSEAFPRRPGSAAVNGRYYESVSPGVGRRSLPSIQSDVVEGPYVRLRIPFVARRDADDMRERCPDLPALSRRGPVRTSLREPPPEPAEEQALIACMAGQWTVRLDGAPVSPAWVLDMRSGSGIEGLVAYLATDALAPGTHLLEVSEVPAAPGREAADGEDEPGPRRHFIRFWV